MKSRMLAVCLVSAAMLFAAVPAISAPGGWAGSNSASVTMYLTPVTAATSVTPGLGIGLTGKVTNGADRKARYTYKLWSMSSCGQKVDIMSGRMTFGPNEAIIWSTSHMIPDNTCTGPWEATIQFSDSNGVLATASTTTTVQ